MLQPQYTAVDTVMGQQEEKEEEEQEEEEKELYCP